MGSRLTQDCGIRRITIRWNFSRGSISISLTYAVLNELDVDAANIRNIYLQATSSQKDYNIFGTELRLENVDKKALIRR